MRWLNILIMIKKKYEMFIVPVETICGKDHNLVLYADEIKSNFRDEIREDFS